MTEPLHLGDEVELVTDAHAAEGAPRGSIGVITDDWADGSNDVEVTDPKSGEVVTRIRAAEGEIQPSSVTLNEPREHGILFGRGDELADDVEEPPMTQRWGSLQIPGYSAAPMAFSQPPEEKVELEGDIPWELQDEPPAPPTGPIFN